MKKTLPTTIISVFNLLFYFSMRCIWSGIEGMFGLSWLAYFIFILVLAIAISSAILLLLKINTKWNIVFLIISAISSIALFYMFYLGIGSIKYIMRSFEYSLMYLIVIAFLIFMLFYYTRTKLTKSLPFKLSLLIILVISLILITFDIRINYFTNLPVVYAVEDNYQIVWTTSAHSTAMVKVGDKYYYDLYAGSENSETYVHKVVVPMNELDLVKSYTISSTTIIFRGPYSGLKGRTISKTYSFYPVDLTDGLNYYSLSDTHEFSKAAIKTGSYFRDNLDFLVLIGDISSHLEIVEDINLINEIAYNITKGSRPVVYARGNHETKSNVANELYKYVGSLNQKFYYTFKLSGVFGIVLDLGEDHNDDWWEFYDTAHFDEYRNEQTTFLNNIILENKFANDDVKYKMVISHIPVNYISKDFLTSIKEDWTTIINQMNIDIMLSGHHHQLMPITTDITPLVKLQFHEKYSLSDEELGYRTNSNFNTFIVSRRSNEQSVKVKENLFGQELSGLATSVDFNSRIQTIKYTNALGEIVKVMNPFTGEEYQEFRYNLQGE